MNRPHDYRIRCVRCQDSYEWYYYSEFWRGWTPVAESNVLECFNLVPLPHPTLNELKVVAYSSVEHTVFDDYIFSD